MKLNKTVLYCLWVIFALYKNKKYKYKILKSQIKGLFDTFIPNRRNSIVGMNNGSINSTIWNVFFYYFSCLWDTYLLHKDLLIYLHLIICIYIFLLYYFFGGNHWLCIFEWFNIFSESLFYDFSVAEQGMEAWKRYIRRDDSKLVDIFVGQLKVKMAEIL